MPIGQSSDTGVYGAEETAALGESYRSTGRQAAASGETSVPDAPVKSQARTRALGPASVAGTLCADPEMRFVGAGKAITKVRIAVANRRQDPQTGEWSNGPTEFVDVSVWGRQGENVLECLRKGDRVVVNGIWQETTWLGKDELEHTTKSITARDIGPSLMFRQARVARIQEGS